VVLVVKKWKVEWGGGGGGGDFNLFKAIISLGYLTNTLWRYLAMFLSNT